MRALRFLALIAVTLGGIAFLVSRTPVALAQAVNSNPQPVATGCQVGTSSTQCIAANPQRKSIQICNPGTLTVWIAPGSQAAVVSGGGSVSIAPVSSNVTSCFTTPTGAGGNNTNVGAQWNAIVATTPTSLTVLEYN
jgi:hypothetical protein